MNTGKDLVDNLNKCIKESYEWKAKLFFEVRKRHESDFKLVDLFSLTEQRRTMIEHYFHNKHRPSCNDFITLRKDLQIQGCKEGQEIVHGRNNDREKTRIKSCVLICQRGRLTRSTNDASAAHYFAECAKSKNMKRSKELERKKNNSTNNDPSIQHRNCKRPTENNDLCKVSLRVYIDEIADLF